MRESLHTVQISWKKLSFAERKRLDFNCHLKNPRILHKHTHLTCRSYDYHKIVFFNYPPIFRSLLRTNSVHIYPLVKLNEMRLIFERALFSHRRLRMYPNQKFRNFGHSVLWLNTFLEL